MKELGNTVLKKCVRPDHSEDSSILLKVTEKKETKVEGPSAQQYLDSLNNNLDQFLAMYEEDAEESSDETKANVVSFLPEFMCCYCHSSEVNDSSQIPCLLCHADMNSAYCMYVIEFDTLDASKMQRWNKNNLVLSENCTFMYDFFIR